MAPVTIPLVQGEQVWQLVCTDKFGLSPDGVIGDKVYGLGTALAAILSRAASGQPSMPAPWQEIGTGNNTFRVGSARPVQVVSVSKTESALPAGNVLASRSSYSGDGIPSVVGQTPWYVTIRLWWRAPDTTLPWPAFTSLFPALPDLDNVNGAEWVLFHSVVPSKLDADPGDASWGTVQSERAAKLGAGILSGVVTIGAAALAVTLLILTVRNRKK